MIPAKISISHLLSRQSVCFIWYRIWSWSMSTLRESRFKRLSELGRQYSPQQLRWLKMFVSLLILQFLTSNRILQTGALTVHKFQDAYYQIDLGKVRKVHVVVVSRGWRVFQDFERLWNKSGNSGRKWPLNIRFTCNFTSSVPIACRKWNLVPLVQKHYL